MNHIRYVLYWEAYENNPSLFLQELENVAILADKLGLKIIYDNHQFHTSNGLMKKEEQDFLLSYLIKVFILLIQA